MHEIKQSTGFNDKLTVFFDGGCPVCRAEIKTYQKADVHQQVSWVDISQCADSELGPQLNRSDALARLHVRQSDGRLVSGARAFVQIWSALPRWRWLSMTARIPGLIHLMELAYVAFLRIRPLWRQSKHPG
jgi:ubiquinone biosynthesis monooxygenase Coq7